MTGEAIKSFLVGLGFGVDDASLSKFNKAISSATLKVTALYGATQAAAAAIGFGISSISEDFEKMGYEYRLIAPAVNKALILRNELFKAYNAAGLNIVKTVQASIKLNLSLTKTKFALEAIYKSVGAKFFDLLTKSSDTFRNTLYKNMPKIQNALERFVFFIFKAFDATIILGQRVWSILTRIYDFFVMLHKATDGWSTIVLGVIAAWKLLNLSFLATPLGMLIAGFTALLALWDDFKTFMEGGQSLINWGSDTTKMIVGMVAAVGALSAAIIAVASIYSIWTNATKVATLAQTALNIVMAANPIGLVVLAVTALIAGITFLDQKWQIFGGHVAGFFTGIGDKVLSFLGGGPLQNGIQQPNGFFQQAPPVSSSSVQNSNTQHLSQETNINVTSSADAASVGKHVVGEQTRVNADMARNFLSPTQ